MSIPELIEWLIWFIPGDATPEEVGNMLSVAVPVMLVITVSLLVSLKAALKVAAYIVWAVTFYMALSMLSALLGLGHLPMWYLGYIYPYAYDIWPLVIGIALVGLWVTCDGFAGWVTGNSHVTHKGKATQAEVEFKQQNPLQPPAPRPGILQQWA